MQSTLQEELDGVAHWATTNRLNIAKSREMLFWLSLWVVVGDPRLLSRWRWSESAPFGSSGRVGRWPSPPKLLASDVVTALVVNSDVGSSWDSEILPHEVRLTLLPEFCNRTKCLPETVVDILWAG